MTTQEYNKLPYILTIQILFTYSVAADFELWLKTGEQKLYVDLFLLDVKLKTKQNTELTCGLTD